MMKMGSISVHMLTDGMVKVDGGAVFGQVPKVTWEGFVKPDRRNRILRQRRGGCAGAAGVDRVVRRTLLRTPMRSMWADGPSSELTAGSE